MARYLVHQFGDDFVVRLYKGQEVTLSRDHRQVAEWVARGTYPIVLGSVQSMIEMFRKEGFPIGFSERRARESPRGIQHYFHY